MKPDWRLYAAVAIGGAIGSIARFGLTQVVSARFPGPFPAATLGINIVGSFLLGFLVQLSLGPTALSPEVRLFLTTGFCGGFTTFSAFSLETVKLAEGGQYLTAGTYIASSVVLSLLACLTGIRIAK